MKWLEAAGDVVAIEDLKKKVRQRMELSGKYNIFNYSSGNQTKDTKQLPTYHQIFQIL